MTKFDGNCEGQRSAASEAVAKACYLTSEPHLSGHRVILGFNTLLEAQDAYTTFVRLARDETALPVLFPGNELNTGPEDPGLGLIMRERNRQRAELGYTAERDDTYVDGDLWKAAHAFLSTLAGYEAGESLGNIAKDPPDYWPWADNHWKPAGATQDLTRAGALIAAELSRRARAKARFVQLIIEAAVAGGADRPHAEAEAEAALEEHLKEEGIEVGHPHYAWDEGGAADLAREYILDHLEAEGATHG